MTGENRVTSDRIIGSQVTMDPIDQQHGAIGNIPHMFSVGKQILLQAKELFGYLSHNFRRHLEFLVLFPHICAAYITKGYQGYKDQRFYKKMTGIADLLCKSTESTSMSNPKSLGGSGAVTGLPPKRTSGVAERCEASRVAMSPDSPRNTRPAQKLEHVVQAIQASC